MLVYRIEHRDSRKGAYHVAYKEMLEHHHYQDRQEFHPPPRNDDLLIENASIQFPGIRNEDSDGYVSHEWKPFIFGFESIAQFRRWFYNASVLIPLKQKGLHLTIYEVPESKVIKGYTQLVFKKYGHKKRQPVKTYELDNVPVD